MRKSSLNKSGPHQEGYQGTRKQAGIHTYSKAMNPQTPSTWELEGWSSELEVRVASRIYSSNEHRGGDKQGTSWQEDVRMSSLMFKVETGCEMPWIPGGNLNWTVNSGEATDNFWNEKRMKSVFWVTLTNYFRWRNNLYRWTYRHLREPGCGCLSFCSFSTCSSHLYMNADLLGYTRLSKRFWGEKNQKTDQSLQFSEA